MRVNGAMAPPFATRAQAIGFCAFVGFILALPAVFHRLHAPTHEERLATAPVRAGPYSFLHEQIYEKNTDLDLAFVGDSQMWAAIDTPAVSEALTKKLGRPARVVSLGWNWHGEDLTFYVLRDLLERRKVGMVVLRLPREGDRIKGPHPQSFRWFTGWDDPVAPTLPAADRAAFYGIEATGSLRNLLSLARPDLLSAPPQEATLGAALTELGPEMGPFHPVLLPAFHPETPILGRFGDAPAIQWGGGDAPPRSIAYGYASAIHAVVGEHGVPVVFVRTIASSEVHETELPCDQMWNQVFGADTPVLAVRPSELFSSLSADDIPQLYYELVHFNRNGAVYFTRALIPGLLELWSHAAHPG